MMRCVAVILFCLGAAATRTAAQLPVPTPPTAISSSSVAWRVPAGGVASVLVPEPLPRDSVAGQLIAIGATLDSTRPRHRSPFLAWFLSWLVPGGGQVYNGQWVKAGIFLGGAVAGVLIVNAEGGIPCDTGNCTAGLLVLVVSSLGAQIDAPISAARINRRAREESEPKPTLTLATIRF